MRLVRSIIRARRAVALYRAARAALDARNAMGGTISQDRTALSSLTRPATGSSPPGNGTAAQGLGSLDGGIRDLHCGGDQVSRYRFRSVPSIPSPERAGHLARVVERDGRLFAVGFEPDREGDR